MMGSATETIPPMDREVPAGMEVVSCVLCGSKETTPVVSAPDRFLQIDPTMSFKVVKCSGCGLQFQNPRPTPERLAVFYPEHYYAYEPRASKSVQGLKAVGQRIDWWTKMGLREAFSGYPCRGGRIYRWVLRVILWPLWVRAWVLGKDLKVIPYQGRGRFLDVGCGTGGDLAYQRRYGLIVAGVEWSQAATKVARECHGLDVRAGTLEQAVFPALSFDVIHMSHVFEHLSNPAATLDEMHRILDTDGLAILKLPNMASVCARWFGTYWLGLDLPRHLYHFSPDTLTQLLNQHGFVVERIRYDPGSWGFWRESRRFQLRETQAGALAETRWTQMVDQMIEAIACWRRQGSAMVAYCRKVEQPILAQSGNTLERSRDTSRSRPVALRLPVVLSLVERGWQAARECSLDLQDRDVRVIHVVKGYLSGNVRALIAPKPNIRIISVSRQLFWPIAWGLFAGCLLSGRLRGLLVDNDRSYQRVSGWLRITSPWRKSPVVNIVQPATAAIGQGASYGLRRVGSELVSMESWLKAIGIA